MLYVQNVLVQGIRLIDLFLHLLIVSFEQISYVFRQCKKKVRKNCDFFLL